MKLDFETNVSHVSSIDEEFYNDINLENSSGEVSEMLRSGIKAAQDGDRGEARLLLFRVTEIEPDNEAAWMWLASVSEYPEELLGFLNHVLEINPQNERAAEWAQSTKALLSKAFVERGADASKAARKKFARQCFEQAAAHDSQNETAWLWLASVSDSPEEKIAHLKKVLSLDPKNENALVLLKSVKNQKVNTLLQKSVSAAIAGEREAAKLMLEEILSNVPEMVDAWVLKSFLVESFEEKIECFEKILDVDDENELANVNWTALLDIMAKAESDGESDAETTEPESNFAFESNESAELESSLDLMAITEEFNYNALLPIENSQTVSSEFEQSETENSIFHTDESLSGTEFDSIEEDFANQESAVEIDLPAENPSPSYSEDVSPRLKFTEKSPADYLQYASNEILLPHETLPSYYESEEYVAAPFESAENDYAQEFAESEPETLNGDLSETDETPVSGEAAVEEIYEENSVADEILVKPAYAKENSEESASEMLICPFCDAEEDAQAFVCGSCRTVLTLSDLEMLLAHQDADREILRQAVERMEEERNQRDFNAEDFKLLAIGQINLKNLRQGCDYLSEAAQINPNDVVLSSQVNSLKIRLAEIEEQQTLHDSMPKNRKILVVDDSATVRKLISGKLEKSGHEVFCAVDGLDALDKIKEILPDLILLDINMPRMDGYQVCKLIRGNEATKDVPVVMISGKDGFFDKVRGRMAGTTGYITKPFGPETLMKMIDTYIV